MTNFTLQGLYAITDPELLPGTKLIEGVEAALRGGARVVQYRDKAASAEKKHRSASELLACCRDYQVPLLINDDLALAEAIGADGVHLGLTDHDLADARRRLGPNAIIGATCHASLDLARQARAVPVDYVAFGRFFPSQTKSSAPPAPLSLLEPARQLGMPIVAIGGITPDNASQVIEAGADMLAIVHGLFAADDIEARARMLSSLFLPSDRNSSP
ncbi:thiamine phosphate synthase [Mangrovitalea sediminis]|uniref:thiamine phosphate synthase n=1 Tax=Mangrovitalea sediminis TaxID=1982043 RepID=UPI000BE4E30B|nr:thiamine phosphate synthase [Mangrovitalea sediminis]